MTAATEALLRVWRCALRGISQLWILDVVLKDLVAFAGVNAEITECSCLLSEIET